MSDDDLVHRGGCFCGSVRYEVTGKPILSAYCHCSLCQRLNGMWRDMFWFQSQSHTCSLAAAFILTVHFPASCVRWIHPEPQADALASYSVSTKPWKLRWRCRICGCTVATHNTRQDKWSVYGAHFDRNASGIIGWDTIRPTAHIFYETRLVDVQDDLGKWTGYENESAKLS